MLNRRDRLTISVAIGSLVGLWYSLIIGFLIMILTYLLLLPSVDDEYAMLRLPNLRRRPRQLTPTTEQTRRPTTRKRITNPPGRRGSRGSAAPSVDEAIRKLIEIQNQSDNPSV